MEWIWFLLSVALGALLMVGAQVLWISCYIQGAPDGGPPPPPPPVPKEVEQLGMGSDCAAALSLALQFLVQELKVAPAPLAWLHRKLGQECEDLITRTTSGKLFESLGVRSIVMGDSAPRVCWAGVQQVDRGPRGRLRTLDLLLDLDYSGGFRLAVDAGMLLGKTACLDIEVVGLLGRARVRFTTVPYTHWSLSFVSPPHLELKARPLRGRLAALLQAHARRALQRKHTLPNYTIRYKPFFTKIDPAQLDPPADDPSMKIKGNFEITLVEVSRLFTDIWTATKTQNEQVYCSLSLDSNPWISYTQDTEYSTFTLDIVINKDRSQQLGTVFKQVSPDDRSGKSYVIIETIVPLSAAYKADLRRGDIIIAVDSKLVATMSQVAKIVKSISRPCFTVRVERKVKKSPLDDSRLSKKDDSVRDKDTLAVGDGEEGVPRRGKSNSFSFRKMSEVLESARNVGQEGRALLRGAHSNSNIQDTEKLASVQQTNSPTDPSDSQETVSLSSPSKASAKQDESSFGKAITSTPNIISFSKHSDSIQMFGFGLRKRRCSVENRTSSDSSNSSTPTASSPGTPSKRQDKVRDNSITRSNTEEVKDFKKGPNLESQNSSTNLYEMQKEQERNNVEHAKFILGSQEDLTQDQQQGNPKIKIDNQTKTKSDSSDFSDMLQTFTTHLIPLSELLEYNEKMSFKLNRNHRYLNLNVWGKNGNSPEEILLGYLNIPLLAVLKECKKSKIGQNIRKFTLLPPEVNLAVSKTHPLASHSGFEPCLCYGDILLSFSWLGTDLKGSKDSSQDSKSIQDMERDQSSGDFEMVEQASIAIEEDLKSYGEVKFKTHDFLRTHFHRSTQCDFCGKKIWLKDAVQCRDCALCCHKKCVAKCLSSGRCQPPLTSLQDDCLSPSSELPAPISVLPAPEFLMTETLDGAEDQPPPLMLTPTASQESLRDSKGKPEEGMLGRAALAGLLGGLRRVGSAHSLAPHATAPHLTTSPAPATSLRSLPPSPQHTPRRQSPDEECVWAALGLCLTGGAHTAEQLLAPLLRARQAPELLLAGARDTGPRLLGHLPHQERAERLVVLTTEVRMALDEESAKLSEIQSSLSNKGLSKSDRARLSQSLNECDERSQALTALLLHCCSAMQSVNRDSVSE